MPHHDARHRRDTGPPALSPEAAEVLRLAAEAPGRRAGFFTGRGRFTRRDRSTGRDRGQPAVEVTGVPPADTPAGMAHGVHAAVRDHRRPTRFSRRNLLLGVAGAAAAAGGGRGVADLGRPDQLVAGPEGCRSTDLSETDRQVVFANWPRYLDVAAEDAARRPTLERFTQQTGIQVVYQEVINDNVAFLEELRQPLGTCQPTGRDLVVLTDWAAARLVRQGQVQPLDRARMPNVEANLLPRLRRRSWDPTHSFAVPWQSGLAAIAYNERATPPVRTVQELLTRPDLRGRVTVLAEMADTMGLLLQGQGYRANDFTEAQFDEALEVLRKAIAIGQISAVTGGEYAPDLSSGKIAACLAWSGDVVQLRFTDQSIQFVMPDSGVVLYSDNLLVPMKASHKANAERLINYYYDPTVAAEVAAQVNYICPVAGAHAEMEKIHPDLAANPLIFPQPDTLAKAQIFMSLSTEQESRYLARFRAVTAGLTR